MAKKVLMVLASLFIFSGMAYGKDDRWYNFAEDNDLTYAIDRKSILKSPENTYLFWVKITSRKKDYLKNEYKMNELAYVIFNYEIDCTRGMYKARGTIYYDKNGKQLDKQIPAFVDMSDAEPIPPESIMEMAQEAICYEPESDSALPSSPLVAPSPQAEPALK